MSAISRSSQSHKNRRKMRKLNSGRSHGIHSKKCGKNTTSCEKKIKYVAQSLQNTAKDMSVFMFSKLPFECRLKIFSYLTDSEKCEAAKVCTDWAKVMRTPCLWQVADFSDVLSRGELPRERCEALQYIKTRARNYVFHLVSRKALLRQLAFEFDILEGEEIWLKFLIYCLKMTNSHELKVVRGKWTNSPDYMPFQAEGLGRKVARIQAFQKFVMTLKETSPGIENLYIPFDWSPSSVRAICQFDQLHTLELDKYWVFAEFHQTSLNALLNNLPRLKRFKMSVCIPFIRSVGLPRYVMCSHSLEEVDISHCTCFFLWSVNLPSLVSFVTARNFWTGPVLSREVVKVPCLYDILRTGAPNLERYNECWEMKGWRSKVTPGFEDALKSSCYCSKHKHGSLLY